jgi:hypothetical protein
VCTIHGFGLVPIRQRKIRLVFHILHFPMSTTSNSSYLYTSIQNHYPIYNKYYKEKGIKVLFKWKRQTVRA